MFLHAFKEIRLRGHLPLLCGGTGMYLDAALRGYRMVEVPENRQLRELAERYRPQKVMDFSMIS